MSDNLPHTAQPASIKFHGVVSLQKPLIIDYINEFDGGSGGNFEGGLGDDSETNGIFKCSIFSLFSFFNRTLFIFSFSVNRDA